MVNLLLRISNLVKTVKNEISNGSLVKLLLLKSNSIISGLFKNKFISSFDVSDKLRLLKSILLLLLLISGKLLLIDINN